MLRQLASLRTHIAADEQARLSAKQAELEKNIDSLQAKLQLYKKSRKTWTCSARPRARSSPGTSKPA